MRRAARRVNQRAARGGGGPGTRSLLPIKRHGRVTPPHDYQRDSETGFTLVELLVVIAIISVLLALLLPAVQAAREAARRSACLNQLHQQATALLNHEAQHGNFPPGSQLHDREKREGTGWRVLLLPFLEEGDLYDAIAPRADGGFDNKEPTPGLPEAFVCPSSPTRPGEKGGWAWSSYAGVSGARTDGPTPADAGVWDLNNATYGDVTTNGLFYPNSNTRIAQITDGTSQTLAFGEQAYLNGFHHWVVGSLWVGRDRSAPDRIQTQATKNVRYPINGDPAQFGYFGADPNAPPGADRSLKQNDFYFGSHHPNGAHFAFADSSVRFLPNDLNINLYRDLATRNGGEVNHK